MLLTPTCTGASLNSKTARLLNGSEQLVVQFVIVLIGRNVDAIKTRKTKEIILKWCYENTSHINTISVPILLSITTVKKNKFNEDA